MALPQPSYYSIIVPAFGLLVPFILRWIENRSRLKQARHLLDVIKTRDEIHQLLNQFQESRVNLLENEQEQLNFYQKELEKEIKRSNFIDIRLYPILISVELVFFISAIFSRAVTFLENLVYTQGNETLPFLEGIFSNHNIRLGLILFCIILAIFITNSFQKRIEMKMGPSIRRELVLFTVFNGVLASILVSFGLILFMLDWFIPWF